MRILFTFIIAIAFASCGSNTISKDLLLGTWTYENPDMPIVQIITYNEDGTYSMKMGPVDVNGTWEIKDNVIITKSSPEKPGQRKTILKLDETHLNTLWEQESGSKKEMNYVRK